jgi:hypothetical protein
MHVYILPHTYTYTGVHISTPIYTLYISYTHISTAANLYILTYFHDHLSIHAQKLLRP